MKRRDLLQTFLGASLAAAPLSAVEWPANFDASKELANPDWKPVFLDEHQNQTLIVLSDLIIPDTGTPGAKAALVNRFLDKLMTKEPESVQREFLASLASIDGESLERYKSAFIYLNGDQQHELLTFLAYPRSLGTWGDRSSNASDGNAFQTLKNWIVSAFYNSDIGLRELGWDGTFPHGEPKTCGEQASLVHIDQERA